jgi:hypothetical protein
VKAEDLIDYGFESEFVGRLPVIAVLEDLNEDDLYKILKNRYSSVVTAKKQDFKYYGIDIQFNDEALGAVARMAFQEKTGARALISVMEKILVGFERVLPSTDVRRFTVSQDLVEQPREFLQQIVADESHRSRCELFDELDYLERVELLQDLESREAELEKCYGQALSGWALDTVVDAAVRQGVQTETMYGRFIRVEQEIHGFEHEFEALYGLRIRFAQDALKELIALVLNGSEAPLIICRKIFQNYHHGLKLVMERSGVQEFTISREAIENPERYLNEIIQQTYRQNDSDNRPL